MKFVPLLTQMNTQTILRISFLQVQRRRETLTDLLSLEPNLPLKTTMKFYEFWNIAHVKIKLLQATGVHHDLQKPKKESPLINMHF